MTIIDRLLTERLKNAKIYKRSKLWGDTVLAGKEDKKILSKEEKKALRRRYGINFTLIAVVILVMIARLLRGDYYSVFLCVLTLLLFNIPLFVDRTFKIKVPRVLVTVIMLFIFAAEICGEIGSFYTYIPWWDTMLHTTNGFLMAAIGFSLIDILNNHPKFHIQLSPLFVAFVAFCFSMTVGVVWEFFEYGMDKVTGTDMQKDSVVSFVSSCKLNPEGVNEEIKLKDVSQTVITYHENGVEKTCVIEDGYLDIGINDTMKDLIVNCIGAVVFSIFGYFYLCGRNKGKFIFNFILTKKTPEEIDEDNEKLEKIKELRTAKRKKEK